MAKIFGNKPICFIQGASYDVRRKFSEDVTPSISSVVITSEGINLQANLSKTENDIFWYRIPAEFTRQLEPIITTYDITVNYNDGSTAIETGIQLEVKKRINPIEEVNDGE